MNRHTFHALRYVCPMFGPSRNQCRPFTFISYDSYDIFALSGNDDVSIPSPLLLCSLYSQPSLCSLCSLCSRISPRSWPSSCSLCSLLSRPSPRSLRCTFATANDDDVRSRQALCSLRCSSATTGRGFCVSCFSRPPCMPCMSSSSRPLCMSALLRCSLLFALSFAADRRPFRTATVLR